VRKLKAIYNQKLGEVERKVGKLSGVPLMYLNPPISAEMKTRQLCASPAAAGLSVAGVLKIK
jgi:hypothetical protein